MIGDTKRNRPPDEEAVTVDKEGAEAAERAGGDGAMFREGADGTTGGADAEAGAGAIGTSAAGDFAGGGIASARAGAEPEDLGDTGDLGPPIKDLSGVREAQTSGGVTGGGSMSSTDAASAGAPGDDDEEKPESAMGGSGSGGTGDVSPAAGNTVGGRDR